jgi:cellulose synthase/poly-beta-1,6-N-acetylglucosamine synthase-like glycosyltransferase
VSALKAAIGICAFNEENNIRFLLENLFSEQNLPADCRILVVCSGRTDRTFEVVKEFQAKDKRIEPILETVRNGKANALNKIFRYAASVEALILVNADSLPEQGSIHDLLSELKYSNAGVVFAQPMPFKGQRGVTCRIGAVVWRLHHLVSIFSSPKLSGELCSIKASCLRPIPEKTATDEPYIELSVRRQGYEVRYLPNAIVRIRCPTNIVDFFKQRKRIWIGHMQLRRETGFMVSTSNFGNILLAVAKLKPSELVYALLGGIVEAAAYTRAKYDTSKGLVPSIWEPIESTKTPVRFESGSRV